MGQQSEHHLCIHHLVSALLSQVNMRHFENQREITEESMGHNTTCAIVDCGCIPIHKFHLFLFLKRRVSTAILPGIHVARTIFSHILKLRLGLPLRLLVLLPCGHIPVSFSIVKRHGSKYGDADAQRGNTTTISTIVFRCILERVQERHGNTSRIIDLELHTHAHDALRIPRFIFGQPGQWSTDGDVQPNSHKEMANVRERNVVICSQHDISHDGDAGLEHLTEGRGAWNVVTSWAKSAALGQDDVIPLDERYAAAHEYMDAVRIIPSRRRPKVGRFKSHRLRPHTSAKDQAYRQILQDERTPPSPPIPATHASIFQARSSKAGQGFAAKHAEAIVIDDLVPKQTTDSVKAIRANAAKEGRELASIKVFANMNPILGCTIEEAQAKWKCGMDNADIVGALS